MKLLIETQYLPPIDLFSQLSDCQEIIIESCENYQKRSYRNRCFIATANGIQSLTVPLESGKNAQQNIREVKIADTDRWQAQHWQAIRSAYGRAPYFEHYADYLLPFYEKSYTYLFDFNQELFLLVHKLLKTNVQISQTDTFVKKYSDEILDLRNQIRNREQPLSKNFKKYPQLFEDRHGFLPNLSSLDLLFCMGTQGKSYFL
jgi:hypothetical protein